jgi:tetratricopeptide (TPR) repeat protein
LLNEAEEYYDKIIQRNNTNALAYFCRAVNTYRKIETGVNTDKPVFVANISKTSIKNEKNDKYQTALSDLNKAIQFSPLFSYAYYNRAIVKCLLQDYYGALKDYETSIKINADFAQAYFNKGFLLYYLKSKDQACTDFSKSGELGITESYILMKKYCFR